MSETYFRRDPGGRVVKVEKDSAEYNILNSRNSRYVEVSGKEGERLFNEQEGTLDVGLTDENEEGERERIPATGEGSSGMNEPKSDEQEKEMKQELEKKPLD